MDFEVSIFKTFIAFVAAAFGWVMKALWNAVKDLQEKQGELEVLVAGDYAPRLELRVEFDKIERALTRIEQKLDNKADK